VAAGQLLTEYDVPPTTATNGFKGNRKATILQSGIGLRHALTERLEVEASTDVSVKEATDLAPGGTSVTFSASAVYRLFSRFDAAVGVYENDKIGIGLRLTW